MMEEQISVLGSVSFNWLKEHGAADCDERFFMEPRVRLERERLANQIAARHFPNDPFYNFEACLVQAEGRRRPVALVGGLQPNLILGAAVGAKFVFFPEKDPDITNTPLKDIQNLDGTARHRLEKHLAGEPVSGTDRRGAGNAGRAIRDRAPLLLGHHAGGRPFTGSSPPRSSWSASGSSSTW